MTYLCDQLGVNARSIADIILYDKAHVLPQFAIFYKRTDECRCTHCVRLPGPIGSFGAGPRLAQGDFAAPQISRLHVFFSVGIVYWCFLRSVDGF